MKGGDSKIIVPHTPGEDWNIRSMADVLKGVEFNCVTSSFNGYGSTAPEVDYLYFDHKRSAVLRMMALF